MKIIALITLLLITGLAQASQCTGPYNGKTLNQAELEALIKEHSPENPLNLCGSDLSGLNFEGKNLSYANFYGADMSNTNLKGADFSNTNLEKVYFRWSQLQEINLLRANLKGASLKEANLNHAQMEQVLLENAEVTDAMLINVLMRGANLIKTKFDRSDLTDSEISWSNASQASFSESTLSNVSFSETNLSGANFDMTDLSGAVFYKANLYNSIYHPRIGTLPNIISLASAENFKTIRILDYTAGAPSLAELRAAYKNAGMRTMERTVTSILKKNEMKESWERGGTGYFEAVFSYLLFDITSDFGSAPGRPLRIFLYLIFIFAIPYKFALSNSNNATGVMALWEPKKYLLNSQRFFDKTELIYLVKPRHTETIKEKYHDFIRLARIALYFSVITAFQIGWRELNVSTWLTRIQSREYRLQGYGWVRIIAGAHSLLGAYLIVLWALTYFGRPFEW